MIEPYFKDSDLTIYHGDCLEIMPSLDIEVDMILADLPYGTTACDWDSIIPLEPLWKEYKRLIKGNGAVVLTASQPFTTKLISSNLDWFKYEWIWEKERPSNIFLLKKQPGRVHENILVFGGSNYYPQMEASLTGNRKRRSGHNKVDIIGGTTAKYAKDWDGSKRYPRSVLKITRDKGKHPTQKPLELFKYLIKTYTNESDLILDNTMGSGTTLKACQELHRKAIGIEIEEKYCEIAADRLRERVLI